MISTPRCTAGCGRPSPDAPLCAGCGHALLRDLLTVPWLTKQLTITLAKLDKVPAGAGAGPDQTGVLPFRLAVTQAASTLRHTLHPWAAEIAHQHQLRPPRPGAPLAVLAKWLAHHVEQARRCAPDAHGYGPAHLADEIRYAVDQTRRVIDRPPDLFYAGPCEGCQKDLYCGADQRGWPTAAVITCRACSRRYEATERREWLLRAAEDRLATAPEISQAVPALYGHDIRAGTIRQWIHRGRLIPRGWLLNGVVYSYRPAEHARALIRVGDVIDLAQRSAS